MEHRRKLANAFVDDIDFAGTHTRPTFGDDLASEEIVPITPRGSRITYSYEIRDGLGDGAALLAPGTTTVTHQLVTVTRVQGKDHFSVGLSNTLVLAQTRNIEVEIPKQGESFFRLTTIANAPVGGAAVWLTVEEDVDS